MMTGDVADVVLQVAFGVAMFVVTLVFSLEAFKIASPFSEWTRPWLSVGFALAAAVGMNRFFAYLLRTVYTALAVFVMVSIALMIGLMWVRLLRSHATRPEAKRQGEGTE